MATSPFGVDTSQDEQIRHEYLKHEASVRSVGILYYLGAGICGFGAISTTVFVLLPIMLSMGSDTCPPPIGPVEIMFFGFVAVFYVLMTGLLFCTARGLRRLQSWTRKSTGIISALGLLLFPLGTLINAYILYLVLSSKAGVVFSPEYREIIARTPHNQSHSGRAGGMRKAPRRGQ